MSWLRSRDERAPARPRGWKARVHSRPRRAPLQTAAEGHSSTRNDAERRPTAPPLVVRLRPSARLQGTAPRAADGRSYTSSSSSYQSIGWIANPSGCPDGPNRPTDEWTARQPLSQNRTRLRSGQNGTGRERVDRPTRCRRDGGGSAGGGASKVREERGRDASAAERLREPFVRRENILRSRAGCCASDWEAASSFSVIGRLSNC